MADTQSSCLTDEAVRESESQLRLAWESSADGMRLTSREGVILRVNDAYCRMVQKARTELEGRPFYEVYHPSYVQHARSRYLQCMEASTIRSHDLQEVTLWNGKTAWFDLSNSCLEVPDRPRLLLSIFRDVTARKAAEAELEQLHRQLLDVSRQAGMAEVATSVLHNVGNVLNSVNISSALLADKLRNSKVGNLVRAMALMQEHASDLAQFLTQDPKGRQLPGYLSSLAEHLVGEQKEIQQELASLSTNIEHIKEIVAMQQSYARVLGVVESLPVVALVEDALRLNAGAIERHRVRVVREFAEVPPILVDKHRALQILVNLIRNAKYALDEQGHLDKVMTLRIEPGPSPSSILHPPSSPSSVPSPLVPPAPPRTVRISVLDNGIGILAENLTRIFEHGFTTRKQGHGFGLHNSALVAKELNGSLTVHSDGPGHGACFTLELPCQPQE